MPTRTNPNQPNTGRKQPLALVAARPESMVLGGPEFTHLVSSIQPQDPSMVEVPALYLNGQPLHTPHDRPRSPPPEILRAGLRVNVPAQDNAPQPDYYYGRRYDEAARLRSQRNPPNGNQAGRQLPSAVRPVQAVARVTEDPARHHQHDRFHSGPQPSTAARPVRALTRVTEEPRAVHHHQPGPAPPPRERSQTHQCGARSEPAVPVHPYNVIAPRGPQHFDDMSALTSKPVRSGIEYSVIKTTDSAAPQAPHPISGIFDAEHIATRKEGYEHPVQKRTVNDFVTNVKDRLAYMNKLIKANNPIPGKTARQLKNRKEAIKDKLFERGRGGKK